MVIKMDWKILSEKIDSLSEKYIKLLEDICNIESPTLYKEGVDKVCDFMLEKGNELGFSCERYPVSVSGDVGTIIMNPEGKGKKVSLSAHMDTVHPLGLFGNPPVKRADGKLYGPGVVDCKGGLISSLLAMDALTLCGYDARPVQLILQSDEENSSSSSKGETVKYMCEKAKGSEYFINLEGFSNGVAVIKRKGIAKYIIKIKGKAYHSASCFNENAANAITEAAHKIIELEKLKNPDGVTCNCGVIKGGTVSNSVAAECEFTADFRFSNEKEYEFVEKTVKALTENITIPGCSCEVIQESLRPAMEYVERNVELLKKMNKIYEECGLPVLPEGARVGGSDAAHITIEGIPCVDSLGTEGGFIHSVKEFAYETSVAESAKRIAAVIMGI